MGIVSEGGRATKVICVLGQHTPDWFFQPLVRNVTWRNIFVSFEPNVVSDFRVAVIDGPYDAVALSGILARQPINLGSISCGINPNTACNHGTFVMGMLGARQGAPIPGICPGAELLHIPLYLDEFAPWASVAQLAKAVSLAVASGAKLINLSLAVLGDDAENNPQLESALDWAETCGAIVLAAAGNQGHLALGQLLSHPATIPVVAVDAAGRLLPNCNFGPAISHFGIAAFGHKVRGYASGSGTTTMSGTSVATAVATGTLADLWSANPSIDSADMRTAIARIGPRNKSTPPLIDRNTLLRAMMGINGETVPPSVLAKGANLNHVSLQGETTMNIGAGLRGSLHSGTSPVARPAATPADNSLRCACGAAGGTCSCADSQSSRRFIYVLGSVDIRFPDQSICEELQFVAQQLVEEGKEPEMGEDEPLRTWYARVLTHSEARYVARQICWVLKVEGVPAYYLTLRDLEDLPRLIKCLAHFDNEDLDLCVGSSSMESVENCPGLPLSILAVENLSSFEQSRLVEWFAVSPKPAPKTSSKKQGPEPGQSFPMNPEADDHDPRQFFQRLVQSADNLGDTDDWRALNYLAVRYKLLYRQYAEMVEKGYVLDSVKVFTSRLYRDKHIVDPVFAFQNKGSGVVRKYFVRVDVSHMYPMIVNHLAEYFDR